VASVWRSGPTWTLVVDFGRQPGSTPKFGGAVSTPTGGLLLTDGSTGGVLTYDTGIEIALSAPPGPAGELPLIPMLLRTDATGTVAAITTDGWHLLVRHRADVTWTVVPLPT
jgi:hypothetical protein